MVYERKAHHYPESLRPSVMVLDKIPDIEQIGAVLQEAMRVVVEEGK